MKRLAILLLAAPVWAAPPAVPHPFGFDDMAKVLRIGDYDVSPDGKWVAYSGAAADVAGNQLTSALYLIPAGGKGDRKVLTFGTGHASGPRFSPDGKWIAYISDNIGSSQVQILPAAGGPARQITNLSTEASDVAWSPDGKFLLFESSVFPECADDVCNKGKLDRMESSKVKARLAGRLLFRHWAEWKDGRRTHIFRVNPDGTGAKDLTPGDFDSPSYGNDGAFDVSPDGKWLVYESDHDKVEATSTNGDLWLVSTQGGSARNLTAGNPGFDGNPKFSPDGRTIAYKSQKRGGFESDRWELMLHDVATGKARPLADDFPDWVENFVWAPSGETIYFTGDREGYVPVFRVSLKTGKVDPVVDRVSAGDIELRGAGRELFFSASSFTSPRSIFHCGMDGKNISESTPDNEALLKPAQMGKVSDRWYVSSDGHKIQAWLITPPGFDPAKKYPAVMLIHGGPQGAWENGWSYRWNPEVFAGAGYVVYAPNPRGSTGYGQKFVDDISGDWGGQAYDDIMKGADDLESLPFVDRTRIGAAGASFGGFMIDWIEGHTDRFKVLVSHDGVFNQPAMFGSTEELWFPIWEMRGLPWTSDLYDKWNPAKFAGNFKTPMLVIHGEKDYRIPYSQGLEIFTDLQMRGVDSQLLEFPDEGHWVLKPANSRLWHATVLNWLAKYLGGSPGPAGTEPYSVTK